MTSIIAPELSAGIEASTRSAVRAPGVRAYLLAGRGLERKCREAGLVRNARILGWYGMRCAPKWPVRSASLEEGHDRQDAPMAVLGFRQVQLGENAPDVLLNRPLGDP
jgi:hypothetical protein